MDVRPGREHIGDSTDGSGLGENEYCPRSGEVAANVEARQMMKPGLTRLARGVVVAVVLALVIAAPAAAATPPTRTVYEPHEFVIPAGEGCSFDVRGVPT